MELRQGQGLVMTPQLQQAIKLLQMSTIELATFIDQELERNPVLERAEESDDFGIADIADIDPREASPLQADGPQELCTQGDAPDPHAEAALDAGFEDVHGGADMQSVEAIGASVDWSKAGDGRGGYDDLETMQDTLVQSVSLRDHLEAQAVLAFSSHTDRLIASYLIDHVDDGGYLRADMDEVVARLGIERPALEAIVATMQTFDPTGVCARNVEECLAAQLIERNRYDPAMQILIGQFGTARPS
ncbi:MAG: hypothetical protein HC777_03710 [Hyphomonadaceae bacterium]|nr:hypothetical protein [Hyphomonadaceae bacterium]